MNRVAVIIPFRVNPNREDRVPRLCVKAWASEPLVDAVIFVDGSPKPLELEPSGKVIQIHVPYDGNFNLPFMRNVGVRRASDEGFIFVQIMDSDIFPPESSEYFKMSLREMQRVDMLKPFVINSYRSVPDFATNEDEGYRDFLKPDVRKCKRKVFSYSTMFMKVAVPRKIHGWDEAYEVWGAEDDDFLVRASRAGFRNVNLNRPALIHSHHTKDTCDLAKKQTDQYQKNYNRFKTTVAGKLPQLRMPKDWGLCKIPRPTI
jgi:hypothetical protein